MKEQKKSKAKNLTDAICRSLPRLDKRYMKQGDFPGLEFWVQPGGSKSWYYQFRISGLAMNLGETYLVTENGNERLGKQKLDLVVL